MEKHYRKIPDLLIPSLINVFILLTSESSSSLSWTRGFISGTVEIYSADGLNYDYHYKKVPCYHVI